MEGLKMAKKRKNFEKWLKSKKIILRPWQEAAARNFLEAIKEKQNGGEGKTFLLKVLMEFTNEHGTNFELSYKTDGIDPVDDFISKCCEIDKNKKVKASDLYNAFVDYYHAYVGQREPGGIYFGMRMSLRFQKQKTGKVIMYSGVKLKKYPF